MAIEDFKMYEEWSRYREQLHEQMVQEAKEAPKQVVVAPWGRRLGAYLIDSLLLGIPMGIYLFGNMPDLSSLVATVDPVTGQPDQAAFQSYFTDLMAMSLRVTFIFAAIAALYYVVCHATTGQTPGKMAVGIRLVRVDGEKAGWAEACKRALVNPIVQVVPFVGGPVLLMNGLWPLWDEKRQSLGDKLAKTLVVYNR